jgi:hypothetical protein
MAHTLVRSRDVMRGVQTMAIDEPEKAIVRSGDVEDFAA